MGDEPRYWCPNCRFYLVVDEGSRALCCDCDGPLVAMRFKGCAVVDDDDDPPTSSVLDEAARIVHGARQEAYGHPRDNHACTAALWHAYLDRRDYDTVDAVDVCVLNVLQKLSRFANTRQRDSIVDAAGFLANIEMILDGKWDGSDPQPIAEPTGLLLDIRQFLIDGGWTTGDATDDPQTIQARALLNLIEEQI